MDTKVTQKKNRPKAESSQNHKISSQNLKYIYLKYVIGVHICFLVDCLFAHSIGCLQKEDSYEGKCDQNVLKNVKITKSHLRISNLFI